MTDSYRVSERIVSMVVESARHSALQASVLLSHQALDRMRVKVRYAGEPYWITAMLHIPGATFAVGPVDQRPHHRVARCEGR